MGYNIKWENDGVFVELLGSVDSTEISHLNNRLYADERYDELAFQVLDMLDAEIELSKDELIKISALDTAAARWNNSLRMALLSKNEAIIELFEKHYIQRMASTQRKIGAFSNRSDALKWLKA